MLGFGLLIFVHELGHFAAAKWAGIRTEAFAIGMGQAVLSWRKGVGLTVGSTHGRVVAITGQAPGECSDEELARHGLGETEYSLRWLPIGGFVKMLGQDDLDPSYVSSHPRSFNAVSVPKRMVVVSAGVVMNIILAAVLFVVAFMVGVRFEAAVVGDVAANLPAGQAVPLNAEALGVTQVALQPGDRVTHVNGKPAETFADLQIASAMSRPDEMLALTVRREGVPEPLEFELKPEKDPTTGLLSIGIYPGSSNVLLDKDPGGELHGLLARAGLHAAGVLPGMRLVGAAGRPIATYEQFFRVVEQSDGAPIETVWSTTGEDSPARTITAPLEVQPVYQRLRYPELSPDGLRDFEWGLFGLVPLVRIAVVPEDSPNHGVLQADDVVLRIGTIHGPRDRQFRDELARIGNGTANLLILRDGKEISVQARVRQGKLQLYPGGAWDLPFVAAPMRTMLDPAAPAKAAAPMETPAASLGLLPRTRLGAVNGQPVESWRDLRDTLQRETAAAAAAGEGATVDLSVTLPTGDRAAVTVPLVLGAEDVKALHELGWTTILPGAAFEPIYTTRSAGGNPLRAIVMGVEETHKLIVMTYLTIDRLFRGTVGVEQLRGPVGIVHIGTKIADRGFMYLIFFLAMISVNLAVINFLPLPIVDGGLFLFLVYEKFKGRPPSVAFQNYATIAGLFLIGTAFLVVTWNDVVRLFGGMG